MKSEVAKVLRNVITYGTHTFPHKKPVFYNMWSCMIFLILELVIIGADIHYCAFNMMKTVMARCSGYNESGHIVHQNSPEINNSTTRLFSLNLHKTNAYVR